MPDEYVMQRDYLASARLNLQHSFWHQLFGYHLHPDIAEAVRDKPNARVADIATGTAIWPLQLAERYPEINFTGLDVSNAQYPHSSRLPSNVSLKIWDIHTEPPTEYLEAFDAIHLRALISVVEAGDPTPILDRCLKLLKPGGYIQWDEPDLNLTTLERSSDGPLPAMEALHASFVNRLPSSWVRHLEDSLTKYGFEVIAKERRKDKPWALSMVNELWQWSMAESAVHVEATGDLKKAEEWRQMSNNVAKEMKDGNYLVLIWQITVGRRL